MATSRHRCRYSPRTPRITQTIPDYSTLLQTRPWVLANLQVFDREAYVDSLLTQYPRLPEDFRLWILEWPTRAAIGCVWPGLPRVACYRVLADDIERFNGTNWLETIPPMVSAVTWTVPDPLDTFDTFDFLPAILIRAHSYHIWLILDDDEELREEGTLQLRDKVFTTIHGDKHIIDQRGFSECDEVDANWVAWQTRMWAKIENAAERGPILDSNIVITFGIPMPDDHVCITNTWENRFNPRPRMDCMFLVFLSISPEVDSFSPDPLDGLRVHNE